MRASYFSFCAGTLLMLVCAACQGRTADATPNGETVDVDIRAAESAGDTANSCRHRRHACRYHCDQNKLTDNTNNNET